MSRVNDFVTELVSLAGELCPEAEVKVSTYSLEGEDARMKVVVPPDKYEEVDETLSQRAYDILLDEGYQIVVGVYDREELASRRAA